MKTSIAKKLLALLVCTAMLCACAVTAFAAEEKKTITLADGTEWPTQPITVLVGYSAGGNVDILTRFLAEPLSKELGVPIVVENIPGSGSWLAWNQLLNTEPDGYTFAATNMSAVMGHYDPDNPREATIDDFALLANVTIDYNVLAIRNDETRFSDYASLIEYAQENPLVVAATGTSITSTDGSIIKYLQDTFGCDITVVPVDGNADALTMFLAGETDFLTGNIGDLTDAEANGYHPIVVFSEERSDFLPDVPTAIESGVDDMVAFSARGYGYMAGVDQAIIDRMIEAMEIAFNDPDFQENMASTGSEMYFVTGEDYTALLDRQVERMLSIWGLER